MYFLVLIKPVQSNETNIWIFDKSLSKKFKLLGLHFHWGFNNYQGSEHLIDYEKFPLEVNFNFIYLKHNYKI